MRGKRKVGDILYYNRPGDGPDYLKKVKIIEIYQEQTFVGKLHFMDLEPIDNFEGSRRDKNHSFFKKWSIPSGVWHLDTEATIKFTINQILSEKD